VATSCSAIQHFHSAGDAAGLTLTLDDNVGDCVAEGDLAAQLGYVRARN